MHQHSYVHHLPTNIQTWCGVMSSCLNESLWKPLSKKSDAASDFDKSAVSWLCWRSKLHLTSSVFCSFWNSEKILLLLFPHVMKGVKNFADLQYIIIWVGVHLVGRKNDTARFRYSTQHHWLCLIANTSQLPPPSNSQLLHAAPCQY